MPRTPSPDDDAALRWDEFDDPSYVDSDAVIAARGRPAGSVGVDGVAEPSDADPSDADLSDADLTDRDLSDAEWAERAGAAGAARARGGVGSHGATMSGRSALAVRLLTAVFVVVYLAYTVGWIISIGLVPLSGPTLLIEVMYQFSEFLAMLSSALWFGAVIALTRDGRSAHRLGWLALGTLVLVPWPVVLGLFS